MRCGGANEGEKYGEKSVRLDEINVGDLCVELTVEEKDKRKKEREKIVDL